MRTFRIHKSRGKSRIVLVEAEEVAFLNGWLVFYRDTRICMAYASWAVKSFWEE